MSRSAGFLGDDRNSDDQNEIVLTTTATVASPSMSSMEMTVDEESNSITITRSRRKRHGSRNQNRHKEFVKWLLKTFPSQLEASSSSSMEEADRKARTSRQQSHEQPDHAATPETESPLASNPQQWQQHEQQLHVLDVAGGKGEVSARLTLCHNQRVVMVDPRLADIVHCFLKEVVPRIPNKWQQRLQERCEISPNFVVDTVDQRFKQITTVFDDPTLDSSKELHGAVRNSSLIIGLHADGATEAIVDAALKYHKPFVVVPCCVFPNFFLDRVVELDCGRQIPVRTHEQFCQFLLKKDSRFKMERLPFEGRNVAIYWDGKSD